MINAKETRNKTKISHRSFEAFRHRCEVSKSLVSHEYHNIFIQNCKQLTIVEEEKIVKISERERKKKTVSMAEP
jgi:hypothetical protein